MQTSQWQERPDFILWQPDVGRLAMMQPTTRKAWDYIEKTCPGLDQWEFAEDEPMSVVCDAIRMAGLTMIIIDEEFFSGRPLTDAPVIPLAT